LTPVRRGCYGVIAVGARDVTGGRVVAVTNDGDATLVQAVAAGDRPALARLYDRYAGHLIALGQRILGDRREAEDVLHDVFLEVWRQAAAYDPERGSVRAWLLMRMRSRALDRRKAAGFARVVSIEERRVPDFMHGPAVEDPLLAPDREAVRRALAALPPEQRQVLELGYFEGLSSSEIAARVDAPVGTVKSRVAAGLAKLRACLDGAAPENA
jgi:RNA polymerase sigma-70 factor (ECF subfamily)